MRRRAASALQRFIALSAPKKSRGQTRGASRAQARRERRRGAAGNRREPRNVLGALSLAGATSTATGPPGANGGDVRGVDGASTYPPWVRRCGVGAASSWRSSATTLLPKIYGVGVGVWRRVVDIGERATAAMGRWLSNAGVDADFGRRRRSTPPTPRAARASCAGGARAARRLARRLPRRLRAGAGWPVLRARGAGCRRGIDPRRPPRRGGGGGPARARPPRTSRSATLPSWRSRARRRRACRAARLLRRRRPRRHRRRRRRAAALLHAAAASWWSGEAWRRAARVGRAPTARHR